MQALARREVGDFLSKNFVSVYDRVGSFQVDIDSDGRTKRNGGNVAAFFCTPNGYVIHVAAGPRTAEAFLAEAKWAVTVHSQIMSDPNWGRSQARIEQVSRVTAALRQAHSDALNLMNNPDSSVPGSELVLHEPPAAPSLKGLDEAGRRQRKQVHQLLMTRAYEPLANVGPLVYTRILGEKVTQQPVRMTGAPEARQGGRTGQSLLEFYAEGGAAGVAASPPNPVAPSAPKAQPAKAPKAPARPTRQ